MSLSSWIFIIAFFAIPLTTLIIWIFQFRKYRQAKNENKINPGTYSKEDMKPIKTGFIISSVIAFIFMAVLLGSIVLYGMLIMYM